MRKKQNNEEKRQQQKERISAAVNKVVELFDSGDIPKAIAVSTYPPYDMPCVKWSLMNRMIMWASGTIDARGFKQWKEVGRSVKKGSKAIYIFWHPA